MHYIFTVMIGKCTERIGHSRAHLEIQTEIIYHICVCYIYISIYM